MSASAYSAFIGCMLGLYWVNHGQIPPDKALPWSTVLWGCVAIFVMAVIFWAMAGAVMGSNYPASHLPFSGSCWGLIGAFLAMSEPLFDIGKVLVGPLTWLQAVILMGAMVLIALSGLFGWAVGDRISELFKKVDEAAEKEFNSGTSKRSSTSNLA